MTTPDQPNQLGQEVAERLRNLAADIEGSTPDPGAVPDLPEAVAQLRRYAAAAENAPERRARGIALRATHTVAFLDSPMHEARAGTDLGVYSTDANPNYAALAAEAKGEWGPGEGLDPPPPPAGPSPRSGHPIEALGDVADAMREALARQEAKGYRDDTAVIDDVTRQLADRSAARAGATAAAALEYVAADQADASLPAELRDLPDDQRAELLREAGEVKKAAAQAAHRRPGPEDAESIHDIAWDSPRVDAAATEIRDRADQLVASGGYASWTDAARAAVSQLVDERAAGTGPAPAAAGGGVPLTSEQRRHIAPLLEPYGVGMAAAAAEHTTGREPETTLGRDYGAGRAHTTSKEENMDNQANERGQQPAGRDPVRERLEALAAECERGAETLAYEAKNAAEVLATRANGDLTDPQEWAERKRAAEAATRAYAGRLRGLARDPGQVDADLLQQAEKVADAANLGGILIDGSRLDAAAAEHPLATTVERESAHRYSQQKRTAIEGSGLFAHVAEPGQVPYWQLGGQATRAHTGRTARDSAESAGPAAQVHREQGATADTATVRVDASHTAAAGDAAAVTREDTSSVLAKVQRANEAVAASRQPGPAAEPVLGSGGRDVGLAGPQLGR